MEVQTIKGEYSWLPTKACQSVHGDVNTNGFGHFPKMLDGKPGVAMYVIHPDAVRVVPIDTQKAENDACISASVRPSVEKNSAPKRWRQHMKAPAKSSCSIDVTPSMLVANSTELFH